MKEGRWRIGKYFDFDRLLRAHDSNPDTLIQSYRESVRHLGQCVMLNQTLAHKQARTEALSVTY